MGIFLRADGLVRAAVVAAVVLGSGCKEGTGSDGDDSTGVGDLSASLEIRAVIEGLITDGVTGEPLQGITVEISDLGLKTDTDEGAADAAMGDISSRMATTDEHGRFQLTVATTGSHTIEQYGTADNGKTYARTRRTLWVDPSDTLPESVDGQFVIGITTDSQMYPLNGTLRGVVYGSNQRDRIAQAPVLIRYNRGSIEDSSLPRMATTDDDGTFEVSGLPTGVGVTFEIRPLDLDDDGTLDTSNFSREYTLFEEGNNERFIGPVGAFNSPQLLWHNVDSMRTFPRNPEFMFVYSHAMDTSTSSTEVYLIDNDDGTEVPTVAEWSGDGFELTVTPEGRLQPGHNYRILVRAWSLEPNQISVGYINFRTEGGADEDPVPGAPVLLESPANISFYQNTFRLGLEPIQDAESYRIYARIDPMNEWILVHTQSPSGTRPYENISATISGNELRDIAGGTNSLFAHGGSLYFAAAVDFGGRPGALSPVLEVQRTQCLDVSVYTGTNNSPSAYAYNMEGTMVKPLVIQLRASGQVWMPDDVDVTFDIVGNPLTIDPIAKGDFEKVRVNPWTIEWRYEMPIDTDSQFLGYTVDVSDVVDVNGNGFCGEAPEFDALVPTNSSTGDYRFNFEDGNQGWSGNGDWARGGATNVGPVNGGHDCVDPPDDCESAAFFGTVLDGARTDDTVSTLTSPTFRTAESNSAVNFRIWLDMYTGDQLEVVFVDEDNDDAESTLRNFVSAFSGSWSSYFNNLPNDTHGHLEFRFTSADSTGAATEGGVYVDDLSFSGVVSRDLFCNDVTSCPND